MIKLNYLLLLESEDYDHIATEIIKYYGLNIRVNYKKSNQKAHYDVDNNIMYINPTHDLESFLESLLHEINHALMAKKYGPNKFKDQYEYQMNQLAGKGLDPYKNNKFELVANKWSKKEFKHKWRKYF